MEVEEDDCYIVDDIPGVRTLGIQKDCLNVTHTAPSKLQRGTPMAMGNDVPQVTEFPTTDESLEPIGNLDQAKAKKQKDFMKLSQVNDPETHVRLFKSLQEQVTALKFRLLEQNDSFNCLIAEKDQWILKLRTDLQGANTEKETLIKRHDKELKDVKTRFDNDIGNLRATFLMDKAVLDEQIQDLKDEITEKDFLILKHSRDLEELKGWVSVCPLTL